MIKPSDKLLLKETLMKDKNELLIKIANEDNPIIKDCLRDQLKMVESYITICTNRNKF